MAVLPFAALATTFLVLQAGSSTGPDAAMADVGALDVDLLVDGNLIVQGIPVPGGCGFDLPTLRIPAGGTATRWVSVEFTDGCQALFRSGLPADLLGGGKGLLEPERQREVVKVFWIGPPPAAPCKTVEQTVYMYGWGGKWDRLTEKHGKLHFCWDGTNAWMDTQDGDCNAPNTLSVWWTWVVDDCLETSVTAGPAPSVERWGRGVYHCDARTMWPCSAATPDGYDHNLNDAERSWKDGMGECFFTWTGTIVSGVNHTIASGCT